MAKAHIETATVSRIIQGYGFKCYSERKTKTGDTVKEYYTVWATTPAVKEGDIVEVTGDLSVKLEEFTGRDGNPKQTAAIHINNAKVTSEAPF